MAGIVILGVDPGLQKTGWGIIRFHHNALSYIACGTIKPPTKAPLYERLLVLSNELAAIIATHQPHTAALEETFVNVSGSSTLKLGQARGALMLTLAQANLDVHEYAATLVKKSIVGAGRAEKSQVGMMVQSLLPTAREQLAKAGADAIDALAIAICHANHANMAAYDRKTARPGG